MLDSSPVALPRPPKRSASTASLPTPPGTHHHKRSRRRGQSSDSDDSPDTSHHPPALLYGRRGRVDAATTLEPVSPPPSHRKAPVTSATTFSLPLPVTPERKKKKKLTTLPIRDSPNNPFVSSPNDAHPTLSPSPSPDLSPRTPIQERPTVTYVFRGVRGTFPNPLYDHERGRPRSPSARSKLPVEHPDFSPDPGCPPKVLFPAAPGLPRRSRRILERLPASEIMSGKADRRTSVGPRKMELAGREKMRSSRVSGSDGEDDGHDDDDEEEEEYLDLIKPLKLDFEVKT